MRPASLLSMVCIGCHSSLRAPARLVFERNSITSVRCAVSLSPLNGHSGTGHSRVGFAQPPVEYLPFRMNSPLLGRVAENHAPSHRVARSAALLEQLGAGNEICLQGARHEGIPNEGQENGDGADATRALILVGYRAKARSRVFRYSIPAGSYERELDPTGGKNPQLDQRPPARPVIATTRPPAARQMLSFPP